MKRSRAEVRATGNLIFANALTANRRSSAGSRARGMETLNVPGKKIGTSVTSSFRRPLH
jgi:hypothetical protein